jgi:hypothetical protein
MYFDGANLQCFRKGDYKIKLPYVGSTYAKWIQAVPAHDTLLINLKTDPGEKNKSLL